MYLLLLGLMGLIFGGFWGLILGLGAGWFLPRLLAGRVSATQSFSRSFFEAAFSVMGHIAKSDGRVTREEILTATRVMDQFQMDAAAREQAKHFFNQGKQPDFDLGGMLASLRRAGLYRPQVLQLFMEIQVYVALADGEMAFDERRLLLYIAGQLGFSETLFRRIEEAVKAQLGWENPYDGKSKAESRINTAYKTLGLEPGASFAAVKKSYRRLIAKNHPDKLIAKGLPKEMVELANRKTQRITEAYETLKTCCADAA